MARPSYLTRRDGRYSIQLRLPKLLASLTGTCLYRKSLQTSDYKIARLRLSESMLWILRMTDALDYPSLFSKNIIELRNYLKDQPPLSDERLFARKNYEELLKNMMRRAQAKELGFIEHQTELRQLFNIFVQQNVEAETKKHNYEKMISYERGRSDMQNAISAGIIQPLTPPTLVTAPSSLPTIEISFEQALDQYLKDKKQAGANADGLRNDELIIRFLIDHFGDMPVNGFDKDKIKTLDEMMPNIPDRLKIPREHCTSLYTRYLYAQTNGWDALKRLTEARIRNGYHNSLSKFFGWLIQSGYYTHTKPVFRTISRKNLVSLPRDSFEFDEIVKIFSQPLFNGCETPKRIWKPGSYFIQSHIYWGYILLLLHGLRIGEIGQIHNDDIKERNGVYYIDLRAFDPSKGRVAIDELRKFKTVSAERAIPLHPLVIELGLLERRDELKSIECDALFPEWEPYPKPNGELRWGQPITKSWQYLKGKIGIERADVTAYSSRHWFADLLDTTSISHKGRMMVMGHSTKKDIPAGYGSKHRLTTRDLAEITQAASPEVDFMTTKLLAAKNIKNAWSTYYFYTKKLIFQNT
ncbi:DUF6538 domain-containing protein [Paenochrobactrum sp. BZR 588]|uniref:DUF6538 domain-containing protein n=1 Tax=unclassified Paenochrobactrum TaxID=2639760 RepID=UPI003851B21C